MNTTKETQQKMQSKPISWSQYVRVSSDIMRTNNTLIETLNSYEASLIISQYYNEALHVPVEERERWGRSLEVILCFKGKDGLISKINLPIREVIDYAKKLKKENNARIG